MEAEHVRPLLYSMIVPEVKGRWRYGLAHLEHGYIAAQILYWSVV